MANSQAMTTSFKGEILQALHNFGTTVVRAGTGADTFKGALYYATGSLGAGTTVYSTTNEVAGTNYTAGGVTVTNATAPATGGTTAYWTPSASLVYTNVTITTAFDSVLIYNSTQANRAVSVHTFGSQSVTAGTFTLTMPANAAGTALLNLA
jgi:hypothetical protein